jgi:hypothetical protein
MLKAIAAGVFVWWLTGSIVGLVVTHKAEAGMIPAIVAGIWAAWPLLHKGQVARYNFLHPVPKRYKVPIKQAFTKIREILSEKTYDYGDGWNVPVADTQAKRIKASIRWTDEESTVDAGQGGLQSRKVRVKRFLAMDVQMKEAPNDCTVIQFDFDPRAEGLTKSACDHVITGIMNDFTAVLGSGVAAGNSLTANLEPPPWWLLGVTAYTLYLLFGDVVSAVFH